ncbi:hypothetical protein CRE_24220 [Caenorhabditis remanei]|uniref:Uncharacterized protein n=1 Tax=Caenorhabditis remanei TaxID=31234 RepID=E3NCW2_CAERE|nr:hypothetical protein CRE_24220 [Caenorhabditis remanei]
MSICLSVFCSSLGMVSVNSSQVNCQEEWKKEETNTKQSPEHRSESPPPRCPRSLAHLNTVHMRDQTPRAHIRAFNEDGSLNGEYVPSRNLGERIFPAGVSNDVSGGNDQQVGPSEKADEQRGGVGDKGNK